jgi:acetolactate synthase-1/2/3 large subunit
LARLRELLAAAQRPLVIVGQCGWTDAGLAALQTFIEANRLPAAAAFRCQDLIDNRSDCYVGATGVGGNPQLNARIQQADLILLVGARPDALSVARYTLMDVPNPQQTLVHVYPDPDELGRVYRAELPICATLTEFAEAAAALEPVDGAAWAEWRQAARQDFQAYIQPTDVPGPVNFGAVLAHLREVLPADAILTNGAGNYTAWCHRFSTFSQPHTQLAPIVGSMGYGVPAAVAAKAAHPERLVVAFAGDGCFLMNGQELATAMMYDMDFICIVVNNNMLGTIRMHQERHYPHRVSGTTLVNPNFAAYAESFGAHGEVVERTEDFSAAFERARSAARAALIELRVDPAALTPTQSLQEVRAEST